MPDPKQDEEYVIMKITGVLVDILVDIVSEVYRLYVVFENGYKVLYIQVLHATYSIL